MNEWLWYDQIGHVTINTMSEQVQQIEVFNSGFGSTQAFLAVSEVIGMC